MTFYKCLSSSLSPSASPSPSPSPSVFVPFLPSSFLFLLPLSFFFFAFILGSMNNRLSDWRSWLTFRSVIQSSSGLKSIPGGSRNEVW